VRRRNKYAPKKRVKPQQAVLPLHVRIRVRACTCLRVRACAWVSHSFSIQEFFFSMPERRHTRQPAPLLQLCVMLSAACMHACIHADVAYEWWHKLTQNRVTTTTHSKCSHTQIHTYTYTHEHVHIRIYTYTTHTHDAARREDQPIKTNEGNKKWKAQSEQFRAAIRAARQITEAQAKGIDIRTLKVRHACKCLR
jgi:hypothetical protein